MSKRAVTSDAYFFICYQYEYNKSVVSVKSYVAVAQHLRTHPDDKVHCHILSHPEVQKGSLQQQAEMTGAVRVHRVLYTCHPAAKDWMIALFLHLFDQC
jgi:soluble P-type ATPase